MKDDDRKDFKIPARVRWSAVLVLLGLSLTLAPPWRPVPKNHGIALSPNILLPPVFRPVSLAAAGVPVTTGCKGTPKPGDTLLGGADGSLQITMNSLSLLTAANVEAKIVTSPKVLDFAKNAGVFGTFAQNVNIATNTYTQIKGVVSGTIKILCAVQYDKTNKTCSGGGVETYVTKGGTALATPDGVGLPATASQMNAGAEQSFTFDLPSPVTVSTGATKQIDMYFNNNAACELWDVSTLQTPEHSAGTDFKIVPGSQSPSQAKVP